MDSTHSNVCYLCMHLLNNISHTLAQLGTNNLLQVYGYHSQLLTIKMHKNVYHTEPQLTVVLVVKGA